MFKSMKKIYLLTLDFNGKFEFNFILKEFLDRK